MSKKRDFSKIKKQLLLRKEQLDAELKELAIREGKTGDVKDPGDEALSAVLESVTTSLQNTELKEYKMIVKALTFLEKGTYGICVDCSEDINLKRLAAYPNVLRCLICQEKEEDGSNDSYSSFL